ncbi:MAG: MBL fold metallo-hydrolase [Polyangiaceae bacterium]|nr:MBL fold metallo-hydrolase [Polyangiaceae bacterium]
MTKYRFFHQSLPSFAAILMLAAVLPACGGDKGDPGAAGPAGVDGRDGADGMNGTPGAPGAPGDPGESFVVDQSLPPIEKAFVGVGGKDAVMGLTGLKIQSKGARWLQGEGYEPHTPAIKTTLFTVDVTADLAADNLRLDWKRDVDVLGIQASLQASEIIAGNLGVISGNESIFGFPAGDMLSDRWASVRKQQWILNPHLLLKQAAADPTMILDDKGVALLDGTVHHLVVLENDISPITLYVNQATGWINKLTLSENDNLHRDVDVEVLYYGWAAPAAGGLKFPSDVYIARSGEIIHQEARSSVEVNPAIAAGTFDFPAGSNPMYSEMDAHRGEANHQWHQMFAGSGLPFDGQQTFINPVELAPGVFHLMGGSHHSLLVEQQNGLVLVEAPLDQGHAEALLAHVSTVFPSKPITHVIATHHHDDHSSGVRTIAAAGATVVASAASSTFWNHILTARSSIFPDAMETNPVKAPVMWVPELGSLNLDDNARPVSAYHIKTDHAADLLIVHLPSQNVLFQSDMLSSGGPIMFFGVFAANAKDLHDGIMANGIDAPNLVIAGGHGAGTNTFSELQAALGL